MNSIPRQTQPLKAHSARRDADLQYINNTFLEICRKPELTADNNPLENSPRL